MLDIHSQSIVKMFPKNLKLNSQHMNNILMIFQTTHIS